MPALVPLNDIAGLIEQDPASFPTSIAPDVGRLLPDVGRLLYALVRCYRPRLALETGCYIGYSSLCIAQALADNGAGHLHSFDLFLELPGYVSPVIGPCPDRQEAARQHIARAGLSGLVSFHKGDSPTEIEKVFRNDPVPIDFAFLDGDHRIRGVLRDWEIVTEHLSEGGLVVFHDTEPERCHWLGPRWLLERLGRKARDGYSCLRLPTPDGFGLGLVQKNEAGQFPRLWPSAWEVMTEKLFNRLIGWHRKPG